MFHPLLDALILGIVQGITEFLPISSDGHLALCELLFHMVGGLTFNVMLHAGTLLATIIVLRQRVVPAVMNGVASLPKPSRFRTTSGGRDALVVIVASIPTAIIGLLLRDPVDRWTQSPLAIGLGFLGTSAWVLSARWVKPGDKEQPSLLGAFLIGCTQGLAVLPGLSRSGSTIASALWLGVRPERAFELSFLMSLPAIAGAIVLEGRHAFGEQFPVLPALVGIVVSFVFGVMALSLLRRVIAKGRFAVFAAWTIPLGLATLAMAAAWPH